MSDQPSNPSLMDHFQSLPDPRINRTKRHLLLDILFISICAVLCGAEDFVNIAEFANAKCDWFAKRLELPNGIPSHDTFARVFARLDPQALGNCFLSWTEALKQNSGVLSEQKDKSIAVDGKTLRHSFDTAVGRKAIHMVSAWASHLRLVLAQVKVDDKSNEITAVPDLLKMLDVAGCLVTGDAMNCQKTIVADIVKKGGDYAIALKDNQPNLYGDAKLFVEHAEKNRFLDLVTRSWQTCEKDHGRIETRSYRLLDLPEGLAWEDEKRVWSGLRSIGIVTSTRQIGEKTSVETRYFITNLTASDKAHMRRFVRGIRNHWGIENSLHWSLDMSFNEDACRIRKDNAPENFSVMRRIALNLLKMETTLKVGIRGKRLRAGWDMEYLEKVLTGI